MPLDLDKDPGEGNTNLRAYLAAVLGPRRVAHGARRAFRLSNTRPTSIGQNNAREHETVYLQCWIPPAALVGLPGGGAILLFSSSEDMGNAVAVNLVTAFPGQVNNHFSAVLLPQEELFVQISTDATLGALPSVPLVVSQVTV